MTFRLLQPELLPHSLAQPPDPLINLLRRCRRICRPEEQRVVALLNVRIEPTTPHDQRAVVNNLQENLLLNRLNALLRVVRVLPEINLHPMKHAGHGRIPAHDLAGRCFAHEARIVSRRLVYSMRM